MRLAFSASALAAIASFAVLTSACSTGSEPHDRAASISDEDEAQAAFYALRYAAEQIEGQVSTDFVGPLSISGSEGAASVSGSKTHSSSSSYSSSSSTNTTDIYVSFSGFMTDDGSKVSGTARLYHYQYSRTACSSSYCASASDDYESIEGASIAITFVYNGKTYSDLITVDASSDDDVSSWDVTVTSKSGASFNFTVY